MELASRKEAKPREGLLNSAMEFDAVPEDERIPANAARDDSDGYDSDDCFILNEAQTYDLLPLVPFYSRCKRLYAKVLFQPRR